MTSVMELNPAQQDAYNLLRDKIVECLECVDESLLPGNNYADEVVLEVAFNEMPRLVTALRGVVKDHEPDERGHCQACGYRKLGERFEPTPWPCPVVNSVHAYIQDPARFYQYSRRDGYYR